MMIQNLKSVLLFGVIALFSAVSVTQAEVIETVVHNASEFKVAVKNALKGQRVRLRPGLYQGNFIIDKSITIRCDAGAIFDASGVNDGIRVSAAHVRIENCKIQNWGYDLTEMNAGIYVGKTATNILIKNNYLHGGGFGILLDSAIKPKIINNQVKGKLSIRSQDRGNGIHLHNVSGADIANNTVWHTRDGIYIDNSKNNILRGNTLHHLRYGVHYMYSYHNIVKNNKTHHTRTGYALMQSKYLTVVGNQSYQDKNYGILMNFITRSKIHRNRIIHIHQPYGVDGKQIVQGSEGKALFIYNSLYNEISNNLLQDSDLGIHLTAGSEDNKIFSNQFVRNRTQVKYVANRKQEWSYARKGNYWSDYLGWDRDGNGIGDKPYEPNDGVDKLLWKYPSARILINSPAIITLRWVQKEFPVTKSVGVKDSFPLMKKPLADLVVGKK